MIKRREFDEAIILLNGLYGCEGQDNYWPEALFHIARVRAAQGKKKKAIRRLKEAIKDSAYFHGYVGPDSIIKWVNESPEFDKYRNTEEFQNVLNFEWKQENEIKLENKIKHYLSEKQINPKQIDPIRLDLIEYLLAYSESDVYLDFNIGTNWLVNSSTSILIVKKEMLDLQGILKDRFHYAEFNFSQDKLTSISDLDIQDKTYHVKNVVYNKPDIETALKICKGPVDVDILNDSKGLIIKSVEDISHYTRECRGYRGYSKKRSYDYFVIVFPLSSNSRESIMEFLEKYGSQEFFEIRNIIKKNYPENLLNQSFKESFDADRYQDIDPSKASFKAFFDKIKSEIDETKDNYRKLEILLKYVQILFPYFSKEELKIFTNFVQEITETMLRETSIDDIQAMISVPNEILRTLLESAGFNYECYFFDLIKEKIEMIDDDHTRLTILIHFDNHGCSRNPDLKKMLSQEIKTQFIKAKVPIIKSLLEQKYASRLSKAERTEVIEQINLDGLRNYISTELKSWNQRFTHSYSKNLHYRIPLNENILLFELLYNFSKYNVQLAKTILNKELEENLVRFNGTTLIHLIKKKYFSYMKPEQVNKISNNLNFDELFTELGFISGVHLLERLSTLGFKNAQETIKNQALRLALNNEVNTELKTFKKYVSDKELANYLESHDA